MRTHTHTMRIEWAYVPDAKDELNALRRELVSAHSLSLRIKQTVLTHVHDVYAIIENHFDKGIAKIDKKIDAMIAEMPTHEDKHPEECHGMKAQVKNFTLDIAGVQSITEATELAVARLAIKGHKEAVADMASKALMQNLNDMVTQAATKCTCENPSKFGHECCEERAKADARIAASLNRQNRMRKYREKRRMQNNGSKELKPKIDALKDKAKGKGRRGKPRKPILDGEMASVATA